MDIVSAFLDMALLGSAWVLWLLVFLSIGSIALILERGLFYLRSNIDFADFSSSLSECLLENKIDAAEVLCKNSPAVEAQMALRGFKVSKKGSGVMEQSMDSYLSGQKQYLDRGLVFLGTLGNNAPFIGLFGTVLGIIEAFYNLGLNPAGGPSVVMSGISEALVATAVGLMVAIPAVIAFNIYQKLIRRRLNNADAIKQMLLAHFGNRA